MRRSVRVSIPLGVAVGAAFGALVMANHVAHAASDPLPGFLTLHAQTRGFMLGRPVQAVPAPDGKSILFLRSGPKDPVMSLYSFDVASGATRELLTPAQVLHGATEQLSAEERARRERMRISTRGFTHFELSRDGATILVSLSGRLYAVRRSDAHVDDLSAAMAAGAGAVIDPRLSPDGKKVAYVRVRDLYVLDLAARAETRLTHTDDAKKSSGLAEFVAQEEMDRHSGFWWSPDGARIACEEVDNTGVEEFRVADPVHPERVPDVFAYPRPGKANARVGLVVLTVPNAGGTPSAARSAAPVRVTWDVARLPYLARVSWRRGGPLTLAVMSRDQREVTVLAWDEAAGATRTLLDERDPAWVNLDKTLPRWLPDGSGFLWSSDRDGTRRLELRAPDGRRVRALSPDGVEYLDVRFVDGDTKTVWFTATAEPTEQHLYRAALDGKTPAVEVSRGPGLHDGDFGEHGDTWVLRTTTLTSMPRSTVMRGAQIVSELPSVAIEPPSVPKVELARAGKDALRAVIVRPHDFDPAKKYPVIVDVYGGPHHQQVLAALPPQLLRQWMADHGYIVIAVDGRGTPARGRAFERALKEADAAHGHKGSFGSVPLDDQVDALHALAATRPEIDLTRVGIYGWSFGGYLAALAVLRRPDVFHVAVAGAPVVDWHDYDTCYTERYLGLPDENPAGYDDSSLLTWAPHLAAPLLLVHGTTDDNVYFLHSLKLADALFRAGKPFDLLPLQGFTHMVPDPLVRERLYTRILDTLGKTLHP